MKPDLSLYIHIPFCVRKCRYCDFLSYAADEASRDRYIHLLMAEVSLRGREYSGRRVSTIYIGGGTPSVMPPGVIAGLLDNVRSSFDVIDGAEITIEVNPGTVDLCKLKEYHDSGINRLSIGLQSTHDSELKLLGRVHTYKEFLDTYEAARSVGFQNINIDLISSLPGQSREDYEESLERVAALHPGHISAYSLQLEEGTYLYDHRDEYDWPDEDLDRELYHLTGQVLARHGYERYEISNYSLPGYESRHNSRYWTRGDYLGMGLGASSMIDNVRFKCPDDITAYAECGYTDVQRLDRQEQMEEYMFLGLRLMRGVSAEEFSRTFGTDIYDIYGEEIDSLTDKGLLESGGRIRLTQLGIDVSNYALSFFIKDR